MSNATDPWICEYIDLIHNFDFGRSVGVRFEYDVCDRADFFFCFVAADAGETHGIAATRAIFEAAPNGTFRLAPDSEAEGTGWIRGVEVPGGGKVELRLGPNGRLNRGAVQ